MRENRLASPCLNLTTTTTTTTTAPIALSFQPPLLALDADRVLALAPKEISSVFELAAAFLGNRISMNFTQSINQWVEGKRIISVPQRRIENQTYQTTKTIRMPLAPQRLDNNIRHGLATLPALGAVAVRVAVAAPSVAVLFDKRRAGVKGVAALRAEEVARVPLGAARHDDLAFDRRLAGFTAWAEHFVEVQRAVEA